MDDLLIPGETCLVFDRTGHQGLTDQDVVDCINEVRRHLDYLRVPENNVKIGLAGKHRLAEVMWNEERDGDHFRNWMERIFP